MHFAQTNPRRTLAVCRLRTKSRSAATLARPPVPGRPVPAAAGRERCRAAWLPPVDGASHDVRRCPVQPAGRGDRGAGVRGDRPGGRGRRPPVDRRDRAAGRRAPPVALVHLGAVAAGAAPRGGLRHHEPVPVQRDRPARPRPGGDAGVPGPARGRAGHLAPPGGPGVRAGGRRGRGRADPPAAGHRLSRYRPGPTGGRVLGQLHPAQPGDRATSARRGGVGGGRGPVRAGLRAGRRSWSWSGTRRRRSRWRARPPRASCPRPCPFSPTCWRCAGFRPATSGSS